MSRDYGRVHTAFWSSASIRSLDDRGKLLANYLLSGPHSNAVGAYLLPDAYIADDLGWGSETVTETLLKLFAIGFAERFQDGRHIVICKFLDWNGIENPNVGKAVLKQIDQLPDDPALRHVINGLEQYAKHFPNGLETLHERCRNGSETVTQTVSKSEPNRAAPKPNHSVEPKGSTAAKPPRPKSSEEEARAELYAEGKEIMGHDTGALITNLIAACDGNIRKAKFLLGDARQKQDPRSWIMGVVKRGAKDGIHVSGMDGMV